MTDITDYADLMAYVTGLEDRMTGLARPAYTFRPRSLQAPCMYNLIPDPGTTEHVSVGIQEDVVTVIARLAVAFGADEQAAARQLLELAWQFREIVDPALWNDPPGGIVAETWRDGMTSSIDEFDGAIAYPVLSFPLHFRLQTPLR